MNNEHLAQDIFDIILNLSDVEVSQFIEKNQSIRTSKKKKDSGIEYLKLFQEYVRQKDSELNIDLIKKKFPTINDTNQYLRNKLLEYLKFIYLETIDKEKSFELIKEKLLLGRSLFDKGLHKLAEKEVRTAYAKSKEFYLNNKSNRDKVTGYLLEAFYLLNEIQIKRAKRDFWEDEKEFRDNVIQPILSFNYNYFNNHNTSVFGSQDYSLQREEMETIWNKYIFYELLKNYYKEKKMYEELYTLVGEQSSLNFRLKLRNPNKESEEFIEATNLMSYFELLFVCIKTKKYSEFNFHFSSIINKIDHEEINFSKELLLFFYKELFHLAFIYSTKTNKSYDLLKDLSVTSKVKLDLFKESEIKNVTLHYFVNDAITKFLLNDFSGFINIIQEPEINKIIKKNATHYYPLKIMLLFAYRIGRISVNVDFTNSIERELDRNFLKKNEDEFYNNLMPFLREPYWNRTKTIRPEKFTKLEESANEFDHFHQIILSVIRKHVNP